MGILEVDNLKKDFDGIKAVDNLSFSIDKGTITGLIGPNGAGKTTVLNLLSGQYRPDSGQILFNGNEVSKLPSHRIARLGISRTFQNIRIFPQISVLENLMLAPQNQAGESLLATLLQTKQLKKDEELTIQKALDHLRIVGLLKKKDDMAETLSHGQRKLLELARALATNAKLLLLDEPTAGVYPKTKKKILDLLRDLRNKGLTVLLIEHDMEVVMDTSDTVIVMDYGKKIAEGPPEKIRNDEKVIEAYLGRQNATA